MRLREDEQAVAHASRTADWTPPFRPLMDARLAMSASRASKRCLTEPTSKHVCPGNSLFRAQCVRWRAPSILSQSPLLRAQTESSFWDNASIPIQGTLADLFERQDAGGVYAEISGAVAVAQIGATARVVNASHVVVAHGRGVFMDTQHCALPRSECASNLAQKQRRPPPNSCAWPVRPTRLLPAVNGSPDRRQAAWARGATPFTRTPR